MVYLRNSTSNWKLTFDMVKDNLLNEEIRRNGNSKVISSTPNEVYSYGIKKKKYV